MNTIPLSDIYQSNYINETLKTRIAHQNATDNVHYVECLEETKPEVKIKTKNKNKIMLLTVTILSFVVIVIVAAKLSGKLLFLKSKFLKKILFFRANIHERRMKGHLQLAFKCKM